MVALRYHTLFYSPCEASWTTALQELETCHGLKVKYIMPRRLLCVPSWQWRHYSAIRVLEKMSFVNSKWPNTVMGDIFVMTLILKIQIVRRCL